MHNLYNWIINPSDRNPTLYCEVNRKLKNLKQHNGRNTKQKENKTHQG